MCIRDRGVLELDRVELAAAVVALVAARTVVATVRTGALDVAIRQRTAGRRRHRAELRLRDDVAVGVQRPEQLLDDGCVVLRGRPRVQVVRQPEVLQVAGDDTVVLVGRLPRRQAFLVGLYLDRRAVLVGPGDHQHVRAHHPLVAGEDVGGDAEPGHVSDVTGTVRIRPVSYTHLRAHETV